MFILSINLNISRRPIGELEWINTAEELLRSQFNRSYRKVISASIDKGNKETEPAVRTFQYDCKSLKKPNMFNTLLKPSTSSSSVCDEIDRYLATDTEAVDDALLWWWERRSMYPSLSQMALDYLSIPGMSVSYLTI